MRYIVTIGFYKAHFNTIDQVTDYIRATLDNWPDTKITVVRQPSRP